MKVGKLIAVVVGGSIILLQVANHQGYIKVDWDKVHKQVEKVEDKATGHSPKWMEKVRTMIYIELISMILHAVDSKTCRNGTKWVVLKNSGIAVPDTPCTFRPLISHSDIIGTLHTGQQVKFYQIYQNPMYTDPNLFGFLVMFMDKNHCDKITVLLNPHFCLP